jgi:membrane protein implicated in regulation of membrane protease activity
MNQQHRELPDLSHVNANLVAAAMIVGAVLLVVIGVMLPDWVAPSSQSMARWLSMAFYVFAALSVCLALYLRSFIRKAQNSARSSVVRHT